MATKKWLTRALCTLLGWSLCAGGMAAKAVTVEQAREILQERYVDEVPAAAMEQETVEATVAALGDPYSWYLTPEELEEMMNTDVDEKVVGIGVTVRAHEDGLEVIRAEDGGPAKEAGLQAGDIIVTAAGTALKGMDMEAAAELIRGEEGTEVTLTYRRGSRQRTVRVVRRAVVIAATRGELLEGGIGYIQCDSFGSDTAGHFEELIGQMDSQANVWVVDLRDNPGGTVDAVGAVGRLFAGKGLYITLRYKGGEYDYYGSEEEAVTDKPVVVLVNGNSASAAEALTGALRDYGRAVAVGSRSFGKGIAQDIIYDWEYPEYFTDGDGIKLTVARFFSPAGNTNDSLGIIPEFHVEPALALEVVKLLAPTWGGEEPKDPLMFSLEGQWYTVELDGTEKDETRREALRALLDALPRNVPVARGGSFVEMETVYEELGLESGHWVFADGEEGTVCDGSVYDTLYTYGLVAGKDDGLFHPNDVLTRAELCQLVAAALQCRVPENASPFEDVSQEAWYTPAVTALYSRGMVQGDENGLFHPEEAVDHQQFFTVMGRLFAWLNCDANEAVQNAGEEELGLRKLREYDGWAKDSVWLLSCAAENESGRVLNMLWDGPEAIDPHGTTTRDEAAAVLYRMLSYLDIL